MRNRSQPAKRKPLTQNRNLADPSRTMNLRRAFTDTFTKAFLDGHVKLLSINYSPSERRDRRGRWVTGAGSIATRVSRPTASDRWAEAEEHGIKPFHGTADTSLQCIMENGLRRFFAKVDDLLIGIVFLGRVFEFAQ